MSMTTGGGEPRKKEQIREDRREQRKGDNATRPQLYKFNMLLALI